MDEVIFAAIGITGTGDSMQDIEADGWFAVICMRRSIWTALYVHQEPNINAILRSMTYENWADSDLVDRAIAGIAEAKIQFSRQLAAALMASFNQLSNRSSISYEQLRMLGIMASMISHLVGFRYLALIEDRRGGLDLRFLRVKTIDEARQLCDQSLLRKMKIKTFWTNQSPAR